MHRTVHFFVIGFVTVQVLLKHFYFYIKVHECSFKNQENSHWISDYLNSFLP